MVVDGDGGDRGGEGADDGAGQRHLEAGQRQVPTHGFESKSSPATEKEGTRAALLNSGHHRMGSTGIIT